jgi:glycosyltransferase involved in cell wall biosynthesis
MRRLRIFTWHVHGNYLYYLSQAPHDFYIPLSDPPRPGYGGLGASFAWGTNVHEIPEDTVRAHDFDLVLFQHRSNWLDDQFDTLSAEQRVLPRIYLEHDPPQEHPTNTRHHMQDPNVLLVHVTPFNQLMWDSGDVPTQVIEHGVTVPEDIRWTGEVPRGILVVNNICPRGRRLGLDIFEEARQHVPLDLVGMGSEEAGGLGEVQPMELSSFEARYRFFFDPIRYTSLGLALCEAMMIGMPVVALATAEKASVIKDGVSGFVDTRAERLFDMMNVLTEDFAEARRLGEGARRTAEARFNIDRFVADWNHALTLVSGSARPVQAASTG